MEWSLVIAIVQVEDAPRVIDAIVDAGFRATRIDTVGGFLQQGNAALLVGTPREEVARVRGILEQHCRTRTAYYTPPISDLVTVSHPIEVEIGGAVIFEVPVERQITLIGRRKQ